MNCFPCACFCRLRFVVCVLLTVVEVGCSCRSAVHGVEARYIDYQVHISVSAVCITYTYSQKYFYCILLLLHYYVSFYILHFTSCFLFLAVLVTTSILLQLVTCYCYLLLVTTCYVLLLYLISHISFNARHSTFNIQHMQP